MGRVLGRYPSTPGGSRITGGAYRECWIPRGPRELLADEPSYPPRKRLSARTLTAGAAVRRLDF